MYKDPNKWAMPFQTYVTLTMLQAHTQPTNKRIKLMERSLFSARYRYQFQFHFCVCSFCLHLDQMLIEIIFDYFSFYFY